MGIETDVALPSSRHRAFRICLAGCLLLVPALYISTKIDWYLEAGGILLRVGVAASICIGGVLSTVGLASLLGIRRPDARAPLDNEIDEQALAKNLSQLLPENDPVPEKVDPEMLRIEMRRAGLRARRPGESDPPKSRSNYTGGGLWGE